MPSNPYKDQEKAFADAKKIIFAAGPEGVNIHWVVAEVLSAHPVSRKSLIEFLNECELGGVCDNRKGVLFAIR